MPQGLLVSEFHQMSVTLLTPSDPVSAPFSVVQSWQVVANVPTTSGEMDPVHTAAANSVT